MTYIEYKKTCHNNISVYFTDKKKKQKMDDIICIKYPPDIYPTSLGMYRESK